MKNHYVLLLAIIFLANSCFAYETIMTREGSYVDLRGQILSPYDPPHPENIPEYPRLQQTITNTEMYYKINMEGYRGKKYKLSPVPAEYTQHYSLRTPHPYTKEQFIKVWRDGKVSFMTGARKDTTVDYHNGLKNYILSEYYEIPYKDLQIDSENKYKKIFDELMEYYAENISDYKFDADKVNKIFKKANFKLF